MTAEVSGIDVAQHLENVSSKWEHSRAVVRNVLCKAFRTIIVVCGGSHEASIVLAPTNHVNTPVILLV